MGKLKEALADLEQAMSDFDSELLATDVKMMKERYLSDRLFVDLDKLSKLEAKVNVIKKQHTRVQNTYALNRDDAAEGQAAKKQKK